MDRIPSVPIRDHFANLTDPRRANARHRLLDILTLQRHFGALAEFAHVKSRFYGRMRRWKVVFSTPINPCARSVCS
jgi:hypothetical protein